jgi:cobalt-zinc-cadmium efflux system protein
VPTAGSISIDGNYNVLTLHVVLSKIIEMEKLAHLKVLIRQKLEQNGIQHVTIEFETLNEKCEFEKCC